MDLNKKRWSVLVISCLINLCIGTGYAWSAFAPYVASTITGIAPGAEGFSAAAASATMAFTISNAVGPITMITGGKINDMLGPKWVVFVGGLMFGGGVLITSFAKTFSVLYLGYGVVMGLGMGLVYGCTIGNTVKFFPDKRGMVGGLTTAAYGLGSVILPPFATKMLESSLGTSGTFKILGIIYLVVICVGAFFITRCPADFKPEGWTPPPVPAGFKPPEEKGWKQMLADPIFYVMIIMLTCGAFFGLMMVSQCKSIALNLVGMESMAAATAVSILALFNAGGRVFCGMISDKIGRIGTLTIVYVLAIIGLVLLYITGAGAVTTFYIGVCLVGFCFGSFMGIFPAFTADQFGPRNNGVNYGIMFIGFAVAGVLGPMIMSNTYSSTGEYKNAFLIAAGFAIVGLVLSFVYRAMSKVKK